MAQKKGSFSALDENRDLPVKPEFAPPPPPVELGKIKMKGITIRIHGKQRAALEAYFKAQGLGLSAGVRQVLYNFMDSKGLR